MMSLSEVATRPRQAGAVEGTNRHTFSPSIQEAEAGVAQILISLNKIWSQILGGES